MDAVITAAIIGCGGRGLGAYGKGMRDSFPDKFKVVSLCDPDIARLENASDELGVTDIYTDENDFFAEKRARLLVIATQDRDHARMLRAGLRLGYDILVEKPVSSNKQELLELVEEQKKYGGRVFVCHELRYAAPFAKAYELLQNGEIGRLISMSDLEQSWYGHFVHSYVRGSWSVEAETSPSILAKCSHDFDLLYYYAGAECESISSYGDLTWFKPENAPEGAAERCLDCPHMRTCPYSAYLLYYERMKTRPDYVFSRIICRPKPLTPENVMEALKTGRYGRCAYKCGNDVADHQVCAMKFKNGVTATLEMQAFTGNGGRIIRLHGSMGEIVLNEEEGTICVKKYGREENEIIRFEDLIKGGTDHSGGDYGMLDGIYKALTGAEEGKTSLKQSIESHLMALDAEESRLLSGAKKP